MLLTQHTLQMNSNQGKVVLKQEQIQINRLERTDTYGQWIFNKLLKTQPFQEMVLGEL